MKYNADQGYFYYNNIIADSTPKDKAAFSDLYIYIDRGRRGIYGNVDKPGGAMEVTEGWGVKVSIFDFSKNEKLLPFCYYSRNQRKAPLGAPSKPANIMGGKVSNSTIFRN